MDGVRHGRGVITLCADQTHSYDGGWRMDQKHGWGTMKYSSGSQYEGEWKGDMKHGYGTMYWAQRQERYRGYWDSDLQHGVGEHVWYAGIQPSLPSHALFLRFNRYVGMMSAGHRHGEGTMLYSTGTNRSHSSVC
jgi:hypothetical protein